MNDITKSPVIDIDAYYVKVEKHSNKDYKPHPFVALHYVISGSTIASCAGKILHHKKNILSVIPPDLPHSVEVTEDAEILALNFTCLNNSFFDTPFAIDCKNPRIPELFDTLYKMYAANDTDYKYYSIFYELLDLVEKQLEQSTKNKNNPKIIQAKAEIDKHFSDNNFNISQLAQMLNINSSYLRREFKKAFSISPIAYLQDIRLQNATSMLMSDYYSVEEIAQKCGYGSSSYFIQTFKKAKGCPPQKYKENNLKSKK